MVNWFSEKSKSKNTKKIHKGTKYVRNPHILRTIPILHLFEGFKIFWDFVWLAYCLNRFITLWRWWNNFRKNPSKKIQKISQGYEVCEESSLFRTVPILHFFGVFEIFWDIIWLGCCLNRFVTLRRWSNDIRKNPNPKIQKN